MSRDGAGGAGCIRHEGWSGRGGPWGPTTSAAAAGCKFQLCSRADQLNVQKPEKPDSVSKEVNHSSYGESACEGNHDLINFNQRHLTNSQISATLTEIYWQFLSIGKGLRKTKLWLSIIPGYSESLAMSWTCSKLRVMFYLETTRAELCWSRWKVWSSCSTICISLLHFNLSLDFVLNEVISDAVSPTDNTPAAVNGKVVEIMV